MNFSLPSHCVCITLEGFLHNRLPASQHPAAISVGTGAFLGTTSSIFSVRGFPRRIQTERGNLFCFPCVMASLWRPPLSPCCVPTSCSWSLVGILGSANGKYWSVSSLWQPALTAKLLHVCTRTPVPCPSGCRNCCLIPLPLQISNSCIFSSFSFPRQVAEALHKHQELQGAGVRQRRRSPPLFWHVRCPETSACCWLDAMRGMKAACLWIIFHFSTPHTHTPAFPRQLWGRDKLGCLA